MINRDSDLISVVDQRKLGFNPSPRSLWRLGVWRMENLKSSVRERMKWSRLDHYIVFHPSWYIQSGKNGGISSRDHFYRRDLVWRNRVWNLPREFWGIKRHFLGFKRFFISHRTTSWYYTQRDISNGTRSAWIEVCMQKLCHSKFDLPIFTPIVRDDAASAPIIRGKGLAMCCLCKIL